MLLGCFYNLFMSIYYLKLIVYCVCFLLLYVHLFILRVGARPYGMGQVASAQFTTVSGQVNVGHAPPTVRFFFSSVVYSLITKYNTITVIIKSKTITVILKLVLTSSNLQQQFLLHAFLWIDPFSVGTYLVSTYIFILSNFA